MAIEETVDTAAQREFQSRPTLPGSVPPPSGGSARTAPSAGFKGTGKTLDDPNKDSGTSLMSRILSGEASRTAARDARQALFGGLNPFQNSGGIPNDRIIGYYEDGTSYTWGEIKQYFKDAGTNEFYYDDADGVERRVIFDASMSISDWFSGGYADAWASSIGATTDPSGITIPDLGGSGGRGGGGGSSVVAPTYIPPPRATVTEQIRNYVVATTGFANKAIIESTVNAYMAKDREAFDKRETEQIDPWQTAKEVVRGTAAYKALHDGRPDSVDEMEWVTSRQAKLRNIGVQDARAEKLGIAASFSGATDDALVTQGSVATMQDTGRMLQIQRQGLQQAAAAVASLI